MTVIAYKDWIIACDSLANGWYTGKRNIDKVLKVWEYYIGIAWSYEYTTDIYRQLYEDILKETTRKDRYNKAKELFKQQTELLFIWPDKIILSIKWDTSFMEKVEWCIAIGSWTDFALWCMDQWWTAEESVKIAIKRDYACWWDIKVFTI